VLTACGDAIDTARAGEQRPKALRLDGGAGGQFRAGYPVRKSPDSSRYASWYRPARPALSCPLPPRLGLRRRHKGPLPILRARPGHQHVEEPAVIQTMREAQYCGQLSGAGVHQHAGRVIATGRLSRVAPMLLRTSPGASAWSISTQW